MKEKMVKWPSNDGQITKSGQSYSRRDYFLPMVVTFIYDWQRYECYLGNIRLRNTMDAMLRRSYLRLVSPQHRIDYLFFVVWGLMPIFLAWLVDAHSDENVVTPNGKILFQGLWSRTNWTHYWLTLPLSLFLLRWSSRFLFPDPSQKGKKTRVVLVEFFAKKEQAQVLKKLGRIGSDTRIFASILVLIFVIHVLDMWDLGSDYVSAVVSELQCYARAKPDWTIFFVCSVRGITVIENLVLVLVAYSCQFIVGSIALLIFSRFLQHNLFYVRYIYLRCRKARDRKSPLIILNLDDLDRCFGLKPLSKTFNMQVMILSIAGAIILLSRYSNIGIDKTRELYSVFSGGSLSDKTSDYLELILRWNPINDVGQLILIFLWLACLVIISIPVAVKFVPLACSEARAHGISLDSYLIQLIPPDSKDGKNPNFEELAKKFARQSFWPSGDFRALIMYFIAIFVLFLIWTPFPLIGRWDDGFGEEFAFLAFVISTSLSVAVIFFTALKASLGYVSTRLVNWVPARD